jgi:hypothetical protein
MRAVNPCFLPITRDLEVDVERLGGREGEGEGGMEGRERKKGIEEYLWPPSW